MRGEVSIKTQFTYWLAREILPHEPALRRWLARRVSADLALDDVVQETYARLAMLDAPEAIASPRAYFFQTARSIILMHLRRSRIVRMESFVDAQESWIADEAPPVDESILWREQLMLFTRHLEQMPEMARTAFKLRFWNNLSFAEIGDRLGMSENAAQKNVARNLQILAQRMAEGGFVLSEASKDQTSSNSMVQGSARPRK